MRRFNKVAASALTLACIAQAASAQTFQDWYPSSIALPNGLQYPCNLTAMPRNMPGVPASDRKFINHTYAMILKAVQAKTVMLGDLYKEGKHDAAYSRYYYDTIEARKKIDEEKAPAGLDQFKKDVLQSIDYQMQFFAKAKDCRNQKKPMSEVLAIPEGRAASAKLHSAWAQMMAKYTAWTPEMKDSIFHHLCALDLF